MAVRESTTSPARQERGIARRYSTDWGGHPFRALQRAAEEMERMFDDLGFGRRGRDPLWSRSSEALWAPDIDVYQKDDKVVIKADLPGLRKDDVSVDISDDAVTIQGERKTEHKDERDGYFRSERSYGSFFRVVPLPEGAMTDQAKASFHDGVLEVTVPAPPQSTRGRRLEITEKAST